MKIDNKVAGGGVKTAFGEFTLASETNTITIEHKLGSTPKSFIIYLDAESAFSNLSEMRLLNVEWNSGMNYPRIEYKYDAYTAYVGSFSNTPVSVDSDTITFTDNGGRRFASYKYKWLALA